MVACLGTMCHGLMMVERLVFEDPGDAESTAIFSVEGYGIAVAVSEVHVMDSYNETFSCAFAMTREQALQLRDLITEAYGN